MRRLLKHCRPISGVFASFAAFPPLFALFALAALAALFAVSLALPDVAVAQGWRMFADEIKREAKAKKTEAAEEAEAAKSAKATKAEGRAVPNARPQVDAQVRPAPIDITAGDSNANGRGAGSAGNLGNAGSVAGTPPVDDTPRGVSSAVSSGGLLDFSDSLVDDAARTLGDAENEPVAPPRNFAPEPPSYRDFPEAKEVARLNDVCFVSRTRGWAVGDRGTVWATSDGGATWALQTVPTDANLFGVSFLDENFGLAVGGSVRPATRNGRGVVLRTIDGGASWGEIETASFPILRDVKILDEETAWLAGDSSELYPSGLFTSADSGLSWAALPGNRRDGWRSALFDPGERIGIGTTVEGRLQAVSGESAGRRDLPIGARRLKDVAFDGATGTAWVVGDAGTAMRSTDFGENWARTPGGFPSDAERYFDLEAVAARDGFVGAVGSPGTLFFYSTDGGNVWAAAPTGARAPLRRLCFVDRETGWAVGDFGTIVSTVDGGRSWTLQRAGGSRAAALGVFGRGRDVPFEALVRTAGDEGFLFEICLAARETEEEATSAEVPFAERLNEAVVEAGASGATQSGLFLLNPGANGDSLEQILARFDRENDGDGLERFREYLVRQIRTWRPSVILTVDSLVDDAPTVVAEVPPNVDLTTPDGTRALLGTLAQNAKSLDSRPRDAFRTLIMRELPGAIQAASDPTAYPEHSTACGLEPWRVSAARAVCRGETQGDSTVDANYFCPTLGRSISEVALAARGIVDATPTVVGTTNLQTLFNAAVQAADAGTNGSSGAGTSGAKGFFAGLSIPPGSDARRRLGTGAGNSPGSSLDALSARAGDRRQKFGVVDALIRRNKGNGKAGEFLLSQLRSNVQNVDPDFAADYLTQAGRAFAERGNWAAAEEAFSVAALELPERPKSREALVWLIQYYCGSEPYWRTIAGNRARRSETFESTGGAAGTSGAADASGGAGVSNGSGGANGRAPVAGAPISATETRTGTSLAVDPGEVAARFGSAERLGETIRELAPETFMSPEIRFPLAAARRKSGDRDGALRYYLNRALASRGDVWGARAQAEYWLSTPDRSTLPNGEQTSPFAAARCRFAAGRPYLDGKLEPEFWDAAAKFALTAPLPELPPTRALDEQEKAAIAWRDENRKTSTDLGTTVSLLCDGRFLYVGVVAPKSISFEYPVAASNSDSVAAPLPAPRPRDANLTGSDRVEFEIDLDGDYATTYRFAFDCRGWASDSAWGDLDWNPRVFVAQSETNADWTLEAAIPLDALAQNPPKSGDVWRFAARRVVPGVGVECWNVENSERGKGAFGFLTFGDGAF